MTASDESSFLDLLYGAAAQPDLWTQVLERFADMVGGTSAWLSKLDLTDGRGAGVIARLDPAMPRLYLDHYAALNPLNNVPDPAAYAAGWTPRILSDEDWMPKAALVGSEYYNDFLRPHGVHSTLMIRLALRGDQVCAVNINRPASREQYGDAERTLAASLHGHLIPAFELSEKLALDRSLNRGAGAIFDSSAHGLFQLTCAGGVLRVNPVGEALLRTGCGLTVRGGRLTATTAREAAGLAALIALAATDDPDRRAGHSMVLRSPRRAVPLSVVVAPMRLEGGPVFHGEPTILVCVTDVEAAGTLSEHRIRALFDLTPAEARLAAALHRGASTREAASALGISVNTANVHLSRIFQKTGVNRQGALLRLLIRAEDPGAP